ncbi:MAG: low molecular weight protein arginine phosphatase [candidate division WOR-3 bacterium]
MMKNKVSQKNSNKEFVVLFVCTGNSCRSPMAKGIFDKCCEQLLSKNSRIKIVSYSCGTNTTEGQTPSPFAIKAVAKYDVDIRHHLSAPISKSRIKMADLILTMEQKHKEKVIELVPEAKERTFLLSEYATGKLEEISDPFQKSYDDYRKVAGQLYKLLKKASKKIYKRLKAITSGGKI